MNNTEKVQVSYVRVTDFKVVDFFDAKLERQIIILYALGEDGIIREFTNGEWKGFPITSQTPPL